MDCRHCVTPALFQKRRIGFSNLRQEQSIILSEIRIIDIPFGGNDVVAPSKDHQDIQGDELFCIGGELLWPGEFVTPF